MIDNTKNILIKEKTMIDTKNPKIDELAVACIRSTCIDVINKANSGHPGMALGSAPILYALVKDHLIANPYVADWINRDRFVLSAGHASALLYTMLHLCSYKVTMDDLKSFRQLDSLTPGHPEYRHTQGVDATSGPLGQGIAQAVGMAMAEQAVAAQYSNGKKLIDHFTYCLCGDGCLEEGISQEAISLAGHQKLNKLILIYDANDVTLDGRLEMSFTEQVKLRFLASEWNVREVKDGNDVEAISKAIAKAKEERAFPTLIIVHTIIGYGSLKQGTNKVHGNPLGIEDGKHAKLDVYHYDHPDFYIPDEIYSLFKQTFIARGKKAYEGWQATFAKYKEEHLQEAKTFELALCGDVTPLLKENIEIAPDLVEASRNTSGRYLNLLHKEIPFIIGGSADVAGSVMTKIESGVNFTRDSRSGRNINFGIREFEMASAQNGMLLHGGLKTYVGCFLVFSDYMKSAIRTAALSKLPAIYLFSHDSIALGEDGPTHQPIEHLAMLRSIPNMNVIRPCDPKETVGAWNIALNSRFTPTALILSRQGLPTIVNSSIEEMKKGAYVISKEKGKKPDAIIIATGSEVSLALKAQDILLKDEIDVRVVSMPSTFLFDQQSMSYQREVLSLKKDRIIACEMLSSFGWYKYAGVVMSIDTFGTSAPAKDSIKKFDFTETHLAQVVKAAIK